MLTFTQQRGQLFCLSLFIKPPPAKVTKQAGKPPSRPVIRFDKSPIIIDEFLIGAKHEFNWVRRCESEGTGWHRLGVKANINSRRAYRKNDLVGKTSSPRWYWMKGSALLRSPLIIICFCSLKTNINIYYLSVSISLPLRLWSDHGKKISRDRNLIEGSAAVAAAAAAIAFCLHHAQCQRAQPVGLADGQPTEIPIIAVFDNFFSLRNLIDDSFKSLLRNSMRLSELIYFQFELLLPKKIWANRVDKKRGWKTKLQFLYQPFHCSLSRRNVQGCELVIYIW